MFPWYLGSHSLRPHHTTHNGKLALDGSPIMKIMHFLLFNYQPMFVKYICIYIYNIYIYILYVYIYVYIYIIKTNYPKHQEHSKNHRIFRGIFPPIWEQPPLLHITFGGCSQGIPSGHVTRDPRSTRLPGTLKRTANVAPENRPAETQ